MGSNMKAVILWPDSDQVSIIDMSLINEGDRYQEAPTSIKVGNKFHRAIVKLISSDQLKLSAKEEEVANQIEEALKKKEADLGRGQRHKKTTSSAGAASANQVASALGERLKPPASLSEKAKQLAQVKKDSNKSRHDAQVEVDQAVLRRTTEKEGDHRSSTEKENGTSRRTKKDTDTRRQLQFSDPEATDEEEPTSEADDGGFDDDDLSDEAELPDNSKNCCDHCLALRRSYNQSGMMFVQALGKFANLAGGVGVQYAQPLPIPDDVPKVEITKKSKVYISTSDKNAIKADSGGDPAKITRQCIVALFGRKALEENAITAKGQKAGTLGIKKNVLSAIRAFVNRNRGDTYNALSDAQFNRIINRKKGQVHRLKKSPGSKSTKIKKSPTKKAPKSPIKLVSPSKLSPTKQVSPPKRQQIIRGSPFAEAGGSQQEQPASAVASPAKQNWSVTSCGGGDAGYYSGQYSNFNQFSYLQGGNNYYQGVQGGSYNQQPEAQEWYGRNLLTL